MAQRSAVYFLALRYLFSKKRFQAVNVVSVISAAAIGVVVAAAVVILSVFNGYQRIIFQALEGLDPELVIVPSAGGLCPADDSLLTKIAALPDVVTASPMMRQEVLVRHGDRIQPAMLLALGENILPTEKHIDKFVQGAPLFPLPQHTSLGIATASALGIEAATPAEVELFVPRHRGLLNPLVPGGSFRSVHLSVGQLFFTTNEEANHMILVPLAEASELLSRAPGEGDAIALYLDSSTSLKAAQQRIAKAIGSEWQVLSRVEQHPELKRLIAVEKWLSFLILAFVLLLATFNVVCTSSMLIFEKSTDTRTLAALGASPAFLRKLFRTQGFFVTQLGALCGLIIGLLLCWGQHTWGWVAWHDGMGAQPYPIHVMWPDLLAIVAAVALLGWLAAFFPSQQLIQKSPTQRIQSL